MRTTAIAAAMAALFTIAAAALWAGAGFVPCQISCAARGEVIGVARIEDDGTIILDLRRPASGLLRYPRSDPRYDMISKHIGPIKPGEYKPVFEFPPSPK